MTNTAFTTRYNELKNAVATIAAREARRPGLWTEDLAAANYRLRKFEADHVINSDGSVVA
jgi:hypothetical protein